MNVAILHYCQTLLDTHRSFSVGVNPVFYCAGEMVFVDRFYEVLG